MPWFPWQRKNKIRAYHALDSPDIEIIAVEYEDKPFWYSVGTSSNRKTRTAGALGKESISGEREVEKGDMSWSHFVIPEVLPKIMKQEDFFSIIKGTVSATSGSLSPVLNSGNPVIYQDRNTIETALKKEEIPALLVKTAADLSASIFVKNMQLTVQFDEIERHHPDNLKWIFMFDSINMIDKTTRIAKAILTDNGGLFPPIETSINIDVPAYAAEKFEIVFDLSKYIESLKIFDGSIEITHTIGKSKFDVHFDVGKALHREE